MANVFLEHITKRFGAIEVVSDVTIEIQDGELLVLVGPSGCGKTTILRMIAGLEEISEGNLLLNGAVANQIPPGDRDIAMVFQNYAVYPHMTVFDIIAFGLHGRDLTPQEIEQRVRAAADSLELTSLLTRHPHELSEGQRQRVAFGHAIVREPQIFLMDEPLLYLDARVRMQTRAELRRLHQQIRRTMVYVTHDQAEAMALGDRIAVMNHGILQQVGTPHEVYSRPVNQFVAEFIGSPTMNFFPNVTITRVSGTFQAIIDQQAISLAPQVADVIQDRENQMVTLGIRPEDLMVTTDKGQAVLHGTIDLIEQLDNSYILYIDIGAFMILASADLRSRQRVGDTVGLAIKGNTLHVFDPETTKALR